MSKITAFFLTVTAFGFFGLNCLAQQTKELRHDFKMDCPLQPVIGESLKIALNSDDMDKTQKWDGLKINWTISGATIQSGQGTRRIEIAPDAYGETVEITADISDANGAKISVSCRTTIEAPRPKAVLIEEFPFSNQGYIKMLIDTSLLTQLQNDPSAAGFVHIFPRTPKEKAIVERIIRNQIRARNFDPARINFVTGAKNSQTVTRFWIVPAGADAPEVVLKPKESPE